MWRRPVTASRRASGYSARGNLESFHLTVHFVTCPTSWIPPRRAQAIAVEEARRNLAWARYRQAAHVSPVSGGEAVQQEVMRVVEQDLMRALQKAVDYSERANAHLDKPERYRRESRSQWRLCRSR